MKKIEINHIDDFVKLVIDLLGADEVGILFAAYVVLDGNEGNKPYLIERDFYKSNHVMPFLAFLSTFLSYENFSHFYVRFCLKNAEVFRKNYFATKKEYIVPFKDKIIRLTFRPFQPSFNILSVSLDSVSVHDELGIFDKID